MSSIYKLIFLLNVILSFTPSLAEANSKPFFRLINIECDEDTPYFQRGFNPLSKSLLRIYRSLRVNGQNVETDLPVSYPEAPEKQANVTGLVNRINWNGQPDDPIYLEARVSPRVRASLLEALCSSDETPRIEAEWIIYSYDHHEGKFFRNFHTENRPITLTLRNDYFEVRQESDRYVPKPVNYIISGELSAPIGFKDQTLSIAFKSGGKTFSFPIRGPEAE